MQRKPAQAPGQPLTKRQEKMKTGQAQFCLLAKPLAAWTAATELVMGVPAATEASIPLISVLRPAIPPLLFMLAICSSLG